MRCVAGNLSLCQIGGLSEELETPEGIAVSALAGDMSALTGKAGGPETRRLGFRFRVRKFRV